MMAGLSLQQKIDQHSVHYKLGYAKATINTLVEAIEVIQSDEIDSIKNIKAAVAVELGMKFLAEESYDQESV